MKRQFVQNLQEGDRLNDYFIAIRKDLRTQQSGAKFLGMVFKDRTGEVGGILWDNAQSMSRCFEVGDVVNVRGTVGCHQNRIQIRVESVAALPEGHFDIEDLVEPSVATPGVRESFVQVLKTITTPCLNQLVRDFLDDESFMMRFTRAAAGKKWHHNQPGGLLQHCLEMTRISAVMCEMYPAIDRDLLLTAIFVHDIGKLEEMTHELYVDYTTTGKLLGHLAIGLEMVQRKINMIDGFTEPLRLQLLHCILSHHGELAHGSPVLPKTLEAIVLHHIDNLDAQANAFTQVAAETRSRGETWSEYIPQIDRQIWTKGE